MIENEFLSFNDKDKKQSEELQAFPFYLSIMHYL